MDLFKNTLNSGSVESASLSALIEHGTLKIGSSGKIRVENDLTDSGGWVTVYEGGGPMVVVDYVGSRLQVTNIDSKTINLRIGQG